MMIFYIYLIKLYPNIRVLSYKITKAPSLNVGCMTLHSTVKCGSWLAGVGGSAGDVKNMLTKVSFIQTQNLPAVDTSVQNGF